MDRDLNREPVRHFMHQSVRAPVRCFCTPPKGVPLWKFKTPCSFGVCLSGVTSGVCSSFDILVGMSMLIRGNLECLLVVSPAEKESGATVPFTGVFKKRGCLGDRFSTHRHELTNLIIALHWHGVVKGASGQVLTSDAIEVLANTGVSSHLLLYHPVAWCYCCKNLSSRDFDKFIAHRPIGPLQMAHLGFQ